MASACGLLAASLSLFLIESRLRVRFVAALGVFVALLLIAMKLAPKFPGHFTGAEWIALAVWLLLGAAMHWNRPAPTRRTF